MKISLTSRIKSRFGIKCSLRGYQLQGANFGIEKRHFALLMDPRLGKTRIDIAVSGYLAKRGLIKKWVVICPSIAKEVWKSEIEQTLSIPHEVIILEGKADERKFTLKGFKESSQLQIIIMNPEATWRLKKLLYKTNPCRITVDESHRIKNHASKQSSTISILGRRAKYRSILTGTFLSKPTDCFAQYRFLDPSVFGTRWQDFLEEYTDTWGFRGYKPETFKNLDDLTEKINSRAFKLTREEAGGFPQEQYQDFYFDLTSPAKRHYQEMFDKLKTQIERHEVTAPIVLTQALRLQQITGGFLPVRDLDEDLEKNVPLGDDRIRALAGLIEEYSLDTPLVIITKFRYELDAVVSLMKKMKRSATAIAGNLPGRDQAKKDFMSGKVDTCVIQQRAGIAIDLSRASTGIFYSYTQSYIDYEQAKARIIARTGGAVSLLHLVARGTVDEDILNSVKTKSDLAKSLLKKYSL